MDKVYLLLGGNIGDIEQNLQKAIELLNKECGTIIQRSSIYKTAPWGKTDQNHFLNQAVLLINRFPAKELMGRIIGIEERMGRLRLEKYGPRLIDIDILLLNDFVIQDPGLIIPHPAMQNRRFALMPLAEIAPDLIHPVLFRTIKDLLLHCNDDLEVSLFR